MKKITVSVLLLFFVFVSVGNVLALTASEGELLKSYFNSWRKPPVESEDEVMDSQVNLLDIAMFIFRKGKRPSPTPSGTMNPSSSPTPSSVPSPTLIPTATPIPTVSPTPTPTASPVLIPTPTATPQPSAGTVVYSFSDVAGTGVLVNGIHSGINFGNGLWAKDATYAGMSDTGYFSTANVTVGSFSLPAGKVLKSIRISGTEGGTYQIASSGNPTVTGTVINNAPQLVNTNWTIPASTVTLTFSQGWASVVDDIAYGDATGVAPTPTPVPTATPIPVATPTPVPSRSPSPVPSATLTPTATPVPTRSPSPVPTQSPSPVPSATLLPSPTVIPTSSPVASPSSFPSATPPIFQFDHTIPQPLNFRPTHPVLLDSYYYNGPVTHGTGANAVTSHDIEGVTYMPRQFTQAPYVGWDRLRLPSGAAYGVFRTYTGSSWLFLKLQRPARIAVLWDGSLIPSWLNGWETAPNLGTRRVFLKNFAAGNVVLGAVGGTQNQMYEVLLAETGGVPSIKPEIPTGYTDPVPNTTCPVWVHDLYGAQAPDGLWYRTWHRPIDTNYWCYFRHEHGSNPKQFLDGSHTIPFGYVTNRSDHFDAHEGFKIWNIETPDRQVATKVYDNLFEVHFGTSRPERSCQRHHAFSFYLGDKAANALLARIHIVGDFGIPFMNGDIEDQSTYINCPNLSFSMRSETNGIKKARVAPNNLFGYENWRMGGEKIRGLGFANLGALTFDTHAPMTGHETRFCTWTEPGNIGTLNCGTPVVTGQAGVGRFLSALDTFYFTSSQAMRTGNFFTDEYGEVLRNANDPDAVQQFVAQGVEYRPRFVTFNETGQQTALFHNDPWDQEFKLYQALELSHDHRYENTIALPN